MFNTLAKVHREKQMELHLHGIPEIIHGEWHGCTMVNTATSQQEGSGLKFGS